MEIDEVIRSIVYNKDIKKFFTTRIKNSPARNANDQTLRIPLKDGELTCTVLGLR